MVDQLDAIGVDIYANVTVKAADEEIKALQSRTRKKTVKIGVDFIDGAIKAMDNQLNVLADKKRDILVDIKWQPTATRKGQFQRDIQKVLNDGPAIKAKTTLDLGGTKQHAEWRQQIQNALTVKPMVVDNVEVIGQWKGIEGLPKVLEIPVKGIAPTGQAALENKAAQPIAPLVKESSGQWLGGGRVLKVFVTNWQGGHGGGGPTEPPSLPPTAAAQPSAVLEAPVTTKTGSSKTTGGAAGTVRETEETTTSSKKTTEAKPAVQTAIVPRAAIAPAALARAVPTLTSTDIPAKTTVPVAPATPARVQPAAVESDYNRKTTDFNQELTESGRLRAGRDESNPVSGATVMAGKFAGGGGEVVSAQYDALLKQAAEEAKRTPDNAKTFFKEMGIKLSAASTMTEEGKKIIQAKWGDLQNVPPVVREGAPIITADYDNMKVPRKRSAFTSGMLAGMGIEPGTKRADILKLVHERVDAAVESFNEENRPQMSEEDVLASFFGEQARPEHENPAVRPGKKSQSVANPKSAFKYHGGTGSHLTQEEVRARNALNVLMMDESRHDVSASPSAEHMELAAQNERYTYATGSEEAEKASEHRATVARARGQLFEQMEAGIDPFRKEIAAMSDLTDRFLGGQQEFEGANTRDMALESARQIDKVLMDMEKANPKFRRTLQNVRSGKEPVTDMEMSVERALSAVGTTRSVLGRNIPLDINEDITGPAGPSARVGGLANFWAAKDIAQMSANQQRAETSATQKALEEYIGQAGLPPASVETTDAEGIRQKLQFVRAPQRRMLVKHPITGDMVGKDFPEDPNDPSVRDKAMAEFKGPTIEQRGNYMYEFQQAVLKRRGERPRLEAAEKELEAGGPKLDRIAASSKTKLNPGGITRRQELQAFVDKGLTQLPQPKAHELEDMFSGIDTNVMQQNPWFQGMHGMLMAAQEDIDKAVARASAAPKHKMARTKELDPIGMQKRMEAISRQLMSPMGADLEDKLRDEYEKLQRTLNLSTSRSGQLGREHDTLLSELHGVPAKGKNEAIPAAVGMRRLALPREIDLKKAEMLEAEADETRAAMNDPFGTVPMQGGDVAIASKLARAGALRAKHEIRNPELPAYLQQLLGDPDEAEGPGATRRKPNDPLVSVPTSSRRMRETTAALEQITSPQMAAGILKRTTSPATQAEAQAALLYKQGVRAFDGKLIGGGGGVQQVFVTNFKEISALVARGTAQQAGVGLPAASAASTVVPLGAPSKSAQQAAKRFFAGGDVPFEVNPRVIEALENGVPFNAAGKTEEISQGQEKLKRTQELVTSRSPTVAAGEMIQALFGGRPEVVTAIQEAQALQTEQKAIVRRQRIRKDVTLPRLAIEQAQLDPEDKRGHERSQRQIQRAQLDEAFDVVRYEDIDEALPGIKDQFKGINPVLKSFTTLTLGAIGGTLLFGATLQAAQVGMELLGKVMQPGIEVMTNFGSAAVSTAQGLGQLTRQSAGAARVGVASALFESGTPPTTAFRSELERAGTVGAGLSALDQQRELRQGALNFRLNPQAGVTFPVGGGPFGWGALNSTLRNFKNDLDQITPNDQGAERSDLFKFLFPQAVERDAGIIDAINDGFSEVGLKVVSQQEAGLTDAEAEAQRVSIGNIKSERDFLGNESVSTLLADDLRNRRLVVVGANTGKAFSGEDIEGALGGQIIEATKKSAQLFVESQEPQIQAQRAVLQEQRALNDRLGPVQVALSAFTQPVLPAGTSIPVGINLPGLPQGPTAASRSNVQQLNQLKAQGQQTILDVVGDAFPERLPAVTAELKEINALSDHLADIQIDLISQQQAHTVHSFNNQLIITQRTMEDLRALTGQGGGSAFGGMQRDLLMANRELQSLGLEASRISLGINERQLNLAEGLAGLGVAGETPEERALRLRATREELADQRRLLDIQGQSLTIQGQTLPLSFKVEDISLNRNYQDAVRSFNLLKEEIQIQANTAQAEDEIRGLSALLEYKVSQLNHDLQAGVGDLNIEMEIYQSAVAATLGDWRATRRVVGDVMDTLRGTDSGGTGTGTRSTTRTPGSFQPRFASGGLFNTQGPVSMMVGEAGNETVAVLRNPRNMLAGLGGGSGAVVNVNVTGNTVRSDQDLNELIRRVTNEVQYSLAQQSALRGLRSPL